MTWEGLTPPYATIVADPPWSYPKGWQGQGAKRSERVSLPYSAMTVEQIRALPVADLAASSARLWLWTTNRYLPDAFGVIQAWGFRYSTTVVWAKPTKGVGSGDPIALTTEFLLTATRGHPGRPGKRAVTSWYQWPRGAHSKKPPAALDLVEAVSPGPYVELFARQPRFGWDSWGWGYEQAVGA